MFGRILVLYSSIAALAIACAPAVSAPVESPCRVVHGEKLPVESGGASAICAAVEQAVAARAPNLKYSAEVRILSKSTLIIAAEVRGRKLPEQHFAVMDRNLNPASLKRFAEAAADEIAKAGNAA